MAVANGSGDFSSKMELDAFRHLFPMQFHDSHHAKSIRPDAREIREARCTTVVLGSVASADGSALVKIGSTTMLAAIKMEIMTPTAESPDEGSIAVEFHMPPICSPMVRPGRPADAAPVISKQLLETITSSGMIDLKELCLFSGKAAWMAYLDIYCLDADGALFDAALLSAVAAFSHLRIPIVSLNDDGRVVLVPKNKDKNDGGELEGPANKEEKRRFKLKNVPFSLTCVLHKSYIIADPTAEEESLMETVVTVVLDSSYQLLSLYKPGGPVVANTSTIQDCVTLAWQRINELKKILHEAISDMEVD